MGEDLDHVVARAAQELFERHLQGVGPCPTNSRTDDLEHFGLPCPRGSAAERIR
jgi:hypothetical protein